MIILLFKPANILEYVHLNSLRRHLWKKKDRLLQLKESELVRNVQLMDTEVQKQDNQLAETRQELRLLQV